MVIKNKEERTESIWRFAAVATIPLLLLFIAGFSLGDTAGKEKKVNKKMLEAVEAKMAETEARLMLQDSFFLQGDEILSEVEAKVDEFDKSLRAAAAEGNVDLLTDWDNDVYEYFERLLTKRLRNLEIKFSQDGKPLTGSLDIGMKYFKEFGTLHKKRLMRQYEYAKSELTAGQLGELDAKEADLKKMEEELANRSKATTTETTLEKLQIKLEKCEAKLEKYAKNKEAATSAKTKIEKVTESLLQQIGDKKWKNDNQHLSDLRTQIANTLNNALTDLNTIQ